MNHYEQIISMAIFIYRKKKYKLKVKIGKQKQILRIIAQGIEPCKCSTKVKYCKNNVLFLVVLFSNEKKIITVTEYSAIIKKSNATITAFRLVTFYFLQTE